MDQGRYQTQTVLIATRNGQHVYSSPDEVPDELRRPLEKALGSELAATIVIADEKGRAEALRRVERASAAAPKPDFPYARQAAIAGLVAFLLWVLATLR